MQGRRRELGLGGYPFVSVATARAKALEYYECARRGGDPSLLDVEMPTFEQVTEDVIKEKRSDWKDDKSEAQWRASIQTYANPVLGSMPVNLIGSKHCKDAVKDIWRTKNTTAKRVLQRISVILRWAASEGFRDGDPTPIARDALPRRRPLPTRHLPSLHHSRVADALLKVRASDCPTTLGLAFELATRTAVRPSVARCARWSEFNLVERLWNIPAERMKANYPHQVWLLGSSS